MNNIKDTEVLNFLYRKLTDVEEQCHMNDIKATELSSSSYKGKILLLK